MSVKHNHVLSLKTIDCPSREMLLDLFYRTRRKLEAAVQLDF